MGGQQPQTQWADNLFHKDIISQPGKTQDEKLIELQNEFREFCRRVESRFNSISSDVSKLSSDMDFVKSIFSASVAKPQKAEPKQPDDYSGWVTVSELTDHVRDLLQKGQIKCKDKYLVRGGINRLSKRLGIVRPRSSRVGDPNSNVEPTMFGKQQGYVKTRQNGANKSHGHDCVYNIEKYVKLLEDCTIDMEEVMDELESKGAKMQGEE